MSPRERLYILATSCPRCGWRPAVRLYEALYVAVMDLPPDAPCMSMRCQKKGCETTYEITARAYHNARAA